MRFCTDAVLHQLALVCWRFIFSKNSSRSKFSIKPDFSTFGFVAVFTSEELAKVAIAVNMVDSNKYMKFHDALMKSNAKNKEEALNIVRKVGVSVARVKRVLNSSKSEIESLISFNRQLGSSVGINGTPAFIVGEELISGAVDVSVLKEKIAAQRQK